MRYPLPNLYESEYLVPMTIVDKNYQDTAALLAEHADKTKDGWMQDLLVLTNSVVHLWESEIAAAVDDALDSAESPFRRIMDEQQAQIDAAERELQSVYSELHSLREENARLLAKDATDANTEKGVAFALTDPETLQFIKDGRKIDAIKRVRLYTFIGLKPAKVAVESGAVVEAARNFHCVECL